MGVTRGKDGRGSPERKGSHHGSRGGTVYVGSGLVGRCVRRTPDLTDLTPVIPEIVNVREPGVTG